LITAWPINDISNSPESFPIGTNTCFSTPVVFPANHG
jgi:hypothetical protein